MNSLEEAKQAVLDGKTVIYQGSGAYVLKYEGDWYILCLTNGRIMFLYYHDGVRTDYKGSDFSVKEVSK